MRSVERLPESHLLQAERRVERCGGRAEVIVIVIDPKEFRRVIVYVGLNVDHFICDIVCAPSAAQLDFDAIA